MKRQVKDLIAHKRLHKFPSLTPDASIFEALAILDRYDSSVALVVKDEKLIGMFSARDHAHASIAKGVQVTGAVGALMTSVVHYLIPTFTLEECLQVMSRFRIEHLPVIEDEKPVALLSIWHIIDVLMEDKDTHIRELTTYITGNGYQNTMITTGKTPTNHTSCGQEAL